jgi:hypothetical protein
MVESDAEIEAEEMNSEGDPLLDATDGQGDAAGLVAAAPDGPATLG